MIALLGKQLLRRPVLFDGLVRIAKPPIQRADVGHQASLLRQLQRVGARLHPPVNVQRALILTHALLEHGDIGQRNLMEPRIPALRGVLLGEPERFGKRRKARAIVAQVVPGAADVVQRGHLARLQAARVRHVHRAPQDL